MAVTIKSAISSVKWDNFGEHMLKIYTGIYENLQYTDCDLNLADGHLRASRMVLGMASAFFDNIFASSSSLPVSTAEPLTVLIPDVTVSSMRYVLQFIYTGEVKVRSDDMHAFLDACYLLHIRGLKSNDGAGISNAIEPQEIAPPDGTNYTSGTPAYFMSVDSTMADNSAEVGQDGVLESTVQQLVLQSNTLGVMTIESLPISKDPATLEPSEAQYYDTTEGDGMIADATHQPVDDDDDEDNDDDNGTEHPYDETISLSCTETMLADRMGELKSDTDAQELSKEKQSASYADRLEMAVNAIVNCGISFRTASVTYSIPKTVLWRRAVKVSRQAKPQQPQLPSPRREAIEAIKAGEKLLNVSRRFDIPISTLHRDKIRLYSEGGLPDTVALKQRDKGDKFKQRVMEAAQKCLTGNISLSEAARMYSLPKTTIWRKIGTLKEMSDGEPGKHGCTRQGAAIVSEEKNPHDADAERSAPSAMVDATTAEPVNIQVQHMPSNYVFM